MVKLFEERCRQLNYELFLLHIFSKAIKGTTEEEEILKVMLSAITAKGALGFSRAFVLYYDKDKNILYGRKGIGPYNREEASEIWSELGQKNVPLENYFEYTSQDTDSEKFPKAVKNIFIRTDSLAEKDQLMRVLEKQDVLKVANASSCPDLPASVKEILQDSEIVIAPLVSKKGIIGIIIADNAFNNIPIDETLLMFISLISIQAGLALENAIHFRITKQQLVELQELNSSMQGLQEQLITKEKLAAMGRMSAYMLHEIKNPVATIGGFAEHILNTEDPETIKRDAKILKQESRRIEQLLNRLSSFSFPSSQKPEEINLLELANEVVSFFELEVSRKRVDISVNIQAGLTIKGDTIQLMEVFFNLISNALESMWAGTISIFTEIAPPLVKISVKDTGKGINRDDIEKITDPFFSTKKGGIGLGLHIVKTIAEGHGGKIEISSQEGKGTIVSAYFPL